MNKTILAATLMSLISLGACADPRGDYALVGGGIGAGTGAVIAGVTGGDPLTGALIGGGVGAVGGAIVANDRYQPRYGYAQPHRYRDPQPYYYARPPRPYVEEYRYTTRPPRWAPPPSYGYGYREYHWR